MIELRTTKSDVQNSIKVVSSTTSSVSLETPVFSGDLSSFYVFRKKGQHVDIYSYNGPLISRSKLVCQSSGDNDGCFAIESRRFNKFISHISGDDIVINADSSGVSIYFHGGKINFPSIDTKAYPWWDDMFNKSKRIASLDPRRLDRAFDYSKTFISRDEKQQHLCSCEFKIIEDKSVLFSTNLKGIAIVEIDGFSGTDAKIHGRDIQGIRKFLSLCRDNVTILEHKNCFFVESTELGSVMGSMKSSYSLPNMKVGDPFENSSFFMKINKDEFVRTTNILLSSSPDDNKRLDLSVDKTESLVKLSMPSIAGGELDISVQIDEIQVRENSKFPFNFGLRYDTLFEIIRKLSGDVFIMAVKKVKDKGYVSFFEKNDTGDSYTSMMGWDVKE